jgi:tRNA-splicing ligase RtcB (3'-phosphate/5'-hydroxy nucleic acid ligase)
MQIINEKKPIKIWTNDIEAEALAQVKNIAQLPFIHKHIAVMPDVHAGKGSTIGTVIATKGAILPAAVGVDLGCGMLAIKLGFNIDVIADKLSILRHEIERSVPVGFAVHNNVSTAADEAFFNLNNPICFSRNSKELQRATHQLGTLGGGNHFIEICYDQNNEAWLMLHSGSRGIGKQIADIHINKAKGLMKQYFIDLPDPDLAYLVQNTSEFDNYIHDMLWAQRYAKANREHMLKLILRQLAYILHKDFDTTRFNGLRVDCHHNYCQMEHHFGSNVFVTRKGAVSAREGELGIIPGSMGAKSFIVRGKGNAESFYSCSHGAGRKMSRTKAKAMFTSDDLAKQTAGIECRKDNDVVDEIPSAYKDIDEVMNNQADLVDIVYTLKQVICVKG